MHRLDDAQVRSAAEVKHTGGIAIIVASGKGGVGKTNLALNMGIQLARRGQRAVLMDADFGLANADILLDVTPLADCSALLDEDRPVDELLVDGPAGLRVLCGVSGFARHGPGRNFDPQDCVWSLERLKQVCDVLLVDCGAGLNSTIESFALAGDLLILTTTPEPTALADCYGTLKLLCQRGLAGRVGVVVNMAESRGVAEAVSRRLGRVASEFLGLSVEPLGHVPLDRHIPRAVRGRVPVTVRYPRCPASTCIDDICARLTRVCPPRSQSGGLWSRVASLFL